MDSDLGLGTVIGFAVAGYVFLTQFHLTRDYVSRLGGGYDVLFLSAAVGFLGLMLSPLGYEFSPAVSAATGIDHLIAPLTTILGKWTHVVPPQIHIVATAVLTAWGLAFALNQMPGIKWYRKRALRRAAIARGNLIEVLLDDALRSRSWVELALESGKSYIGAPVRSPFMEARNADIEIVPVFSGHRTNPDRVLVLARHYGDTIETIIDSPDLSLAHLRVVIPASQIVAARPFDLDLYRSFNPDEIVTPDDALTTN